MYVYQCADCEYFFCVKKKEGEKNVEKN